MYAVDADIAVASTLPGSFYSDASAFAAMRERIFARTWQWLGPLGDVTQPESLAPRELLDTPLLLARDGAGTLRCLSNVCTHRGNILVHEACRAKQIRCGYHSRRFDLEGRMTFMPGFAEARDFPGESDHLPQVPFKAWSGFGFASLEPAAPFEAFFDGITGEVGEHDASRDREFIVDAHWALYVENYLEGFHIPFVHAGLDQAVDYGTYETQLQRYASLQLARDKSGEVAARYWWVFPNLMLNFYPWGLSLNRVEPLAIDRTRVSFRSYVTDPRKLESGAGAGLDQVEHEDEAIVEAVQRGVRSRLYTRGRFSPTRERGVHHFQRLLCEFLARD
jgi:choline monooxygenase